MIKHCQHCGTSFTTNDKNRKFCRFECSCENKKQRTLNDPNSWIHCGKCLNNIGFTYIQIGKITGINQNLIHTRFNAMKLERVKPPMGTWRNYAKSLKQNTSWHDQYMIEYKVKFPDWSYLWQKEKSRIVSNAKYKSMTTEERNQWNKYTYKSKNKEKSLRTAREWKREKAKCPIYRKQLNSYAMSHYIAKTGGQEEYEKRLMHIAWLSKKAKSVERYRKSFKDLMTTVKKGGSNKMSGITGCTTKQLRDHLESNFKSWMTWGNYGTKWHVDHIMPCASFDHRIESQAKQCWHYTNLRPLCAIQNVSKSSNITHPQLSLLLDYA